MRIPVQSYNEIPNAQRSNSTPVVALSMQTPNLIYPAAPKNPTGAKQGGSCRATTEDGEVSVTGNYDCTGGKCFCCTKLPSGTKHCIACNEIEGVFNTCSNSTSILRGTSALGNSFDNVAVTVDVEAPHPWASSYFGDLRGLFR